MSLIINDIINILENFAPLKFKEDFDNVGLMVGDRSSKVKSILVALDCTLEVIEEAKAKGCNLIISHHPLLFRKPSTITNDTLLGKKIISLVKNDINLYSSHTNLDSVINGVNHEFMNILGLQNFITMDLSAEVNDGDTDTGIGRLAYLNEPMSFNSIITLVKKALNMSIVRVVGDENKMIRKIAVVNGSGQDYFSLAKKMGADCIITGDTTYHYVSDFCEENMCIIDAGHFATEWPAIKSISKTIQNLIINNGFQTEVIISDTTRDPYRFK
jgi:dinuclear metal center YbgI/SA1388 family protein